MQGTKTVNNEILFAEVERIIGEGGGVGLRVKGGSMRPFLRDDRDSVHLAPLPASGLRRGMVVLFRYRGHHILHRIRRIEGTRAVIEGDGNYRLREETATADIVAWADAIERGGKRIAFGSLRWRLLTARSLAVKTARTLFHDLRGTYKRKDS